MLKAGQLPAPVIQPLRFDVVGTRIKVDTNTYVQIKSGNSIVKCILIQKMKILIFFSLKKDVPGVKLYFTTDGTKPDPFQTGRTGKASTHKYIGPFRLQLGNRVLKAIAVSRDRLRESTVSTRYIDVLACVEHQSSNSDREVWDDESSSEEDDRRSEFMKVRRLPIASERSHSNDLTAELRGSIDGPINPVNYSGTQINVWGLPSPQLANFFAPQRPPPTNVGPLTENMIKNLNTPRAIEQKPPEECKF